MTVGFFWEVYILLLLTVYCNVFSMGLYMLLGFEVEVFV